MAQLHWIDVLIMSVFFAAALAIGIFQALTGGRQRTIEEFLLANRKLKVLPTVLSLLASLRSVNSVIGIPAECYSWGTQFWLVVDLMCTTMSFIIIERFIVPWLYILKVTSSYEYLEMQFQSRAVRRLASGIGIINSAMYMGSVILSPAIAVEVIAGLPMKISILLMAGFCMVYSALGGMRGVVWTDVLQASIMYGGLIFILLQGCTEVGSFQNVFDLCKTEGRLFFAEFSPNPTIRLSFWSSLFGYIPNFIFFNGIQQMAVQRYVSMPTLRDARLLILIFVPISAMYGLILGLVGLVQVSYFSKVKCDPIKGGLISSPNQIFPFFIKLHFDGSVGINGIILVTLFSSSLSTLSSLLSANAANTWEDFLKPFLHQCLTEFQATLVNKGLVLFYGVVCIGMAFVVASLPSNILMVTWTISGAFGGPVLGMFLLGGLTEKTEWTGALIGGLTGFFGNVVLIAGSMAFDAGVYTPLPPLTTTGCSALLNHSTQGLHNMDNVTYLVVNSSVWEEYHVSQLFHPVKDLKGIKKLFSISKFWYSVLGALTTILFGYLVSVLFQHCKHVDKEIDKKYLISFRQALTFTLCEAHKEADPSQTSELKQLDGGRDQRPESGLVESTLEEYDMLHGERPVN